MLGPHSPDKLVNKWLTHLDVAFGEHLRQMARELAEAKASDLVHNFQFTTLTNMQKLSLLGESHGRIHERNRTDYRSDGRNVKF